GAYRARARGAVADGRGAVEPVDLGAALPRRADRRVARAQHLPEAEPAAEPGRGPARAGGAAIPGGARGLRPLSGYAAPVRALTGIAFVTTGVLHFTHTRAYMAIMPPYVPRHRESV